MDERTLTRKRRLQELIEGRPYLGNQSAFAERAGLSKGRITQLLDPSESFGERSARRIEGALRLSDGYFDDQAAPSNAHQSSEREHLASALETLTKALQNADKDKLIAVQGWLSAMAADPSTAKNKSDLILTLLVTSGDKRHEQSHDEARSSHISRRGPRHHLGDENGRSDTVTKTTARKK